MSIHRDLEYLRGPARNVTWTVKGGRVLGPAPFLVMGIVNVTPDSFSDGGVHFDPVTARARARQLVADGAAIVDLGGESTRPFADPVPEAEELRRMLPVLEAVLAGQPDAVVSVDTYKAQVAERALAAGATIVNDVSAFSFDPELLDVLAQHKPGYVLMHSLGRPKTMQVEPKYTDVLAEITRFFDSRMAKLVKAVTPLFTHRKNQVFNILSAIGTIRNINHTRAGKNLFLHVKRLANCFKLLQYRFIINRPLLSDRGLFNIDRRQHRLVT